MRFRRRGLFMKSQISVKDLSFEFPNGQVLFNNKINFTLTNQKAALVGPNGYGKSTLAQLIHGDLIPKEGRIIKNSLVSYLSQFEGQTTQSVQDYLLSHDYWPDSANPLLEGIDLSTSCMSLSDGEWMKVRLCSKLKNCFLILDEPSNNLDNDSKKFLVTFLKNHQFGFLLISHDRELLRICDEIIELSTQGIQKYGMQWEQYELTKTLERNQLNKDLEKASREKQNAELHRHFELQKQKKRTQKGKKDALKGGLPRLVLGGRKRQAQKTTAKVHLRTEKTIEQKIKSLNLKLSQMKKDPLMYANLVDQKIPNKKLIVQATDLNFKYKKNVFKNNLNFSLSGNFRIALKGANGSGKSTLLKLINQEIQPTEGAIYKAVVNTLYIDQKLSILNHQKNILENVKLKSELSELEIRNQLAQFLFFEDTVYQPVETLSGGERLRLVLACGFLSIQKPQLLILDEPTNNLDLQNIEFLENLVSQFHGAVLMVSHDAEFLKNCHIVEVLDLKPEGDF